MKVKQNNQVIKVFNGFDNGCNYEWKKEVVFVKDLPVAINTIEYTEITGEKLNWFVSDIRKNNNEKIIVLKNNENCKKVWINGDNVFVFNKKFRNVKNINELIGFLRG